MQLLSIVPRTKVVGVVGGMDTGPKCAQAEDSKVTNL